MEAKMNNMWRAIKTCKHNIIVTTDFSVVKLYVTDYPVVKVHVDELSSLRIGQHKLCATLSENLDNIDVIKTLTTV
jgi:hypothetical protein